MAAERQMQKCAEQIETRTDLGSTEPIPDLDHLEESAGHLRLARPLGRRGFLTLCSFVPLGTSL